MGLTNFQVVVLCIAWVTMVTVDGILIYRWLFVYNAWYEFMYWITKGRKLRQREQQLRAATIRPLTEDQVHYG